MDFAGPDPDEIVISATKDRSISYEMKKRPKNDTGFSQMFDRVAQVLCTNQSLESLVAPV